MDAARLAAEPNEDDRLTADGWHITRKVAIWGGLTIVLLWLACVAFAITAWRTNASDKAGQFGDTFGSVNALFSGLALTAVAATLVLTVFQLKLQQREFQKQLAMSRHQSTTDNVFQLLAAFRDIGDRVHADGVRSDEAFQRLAHAVRDLDMTINGDPRHLIQTAFMTVHHAHDYALNHYFRMLYQIVRFIDETEGLTLLQRFGFIRIVRAHLSQAELELIMYNSLTPDGSKFHPLLEKYDVLQNLNTERIRYRALVTCFPIHCARSVERSHQGEEDTWSAFAVGALYDEQAYAGWREGQWLEGSLAEHVRHFRDVAGFDAVMGNTLAKLEQFEGSVPNRGSGAGSGGSGQAAGP